VVWLRSPNFGLDANRVSAPFNYRDRAVSGLGEADIHQPEAGGKKILIYLFFVT
jgi:hypothetical protein